LKGVVYVYRAGKIVRKDHARPLRRAGPHVIRDSMDATWHPADNRIYDSKAKFRAVTRAHGCTEVGDERQIPRAPERVPGLKADIARAIAELGG